MNIQEAKDVLARVNAEFRIYCDCTDGSGTLLDLEKTAGELVESFANADRIKTLVIQRGTKYYQALYAQIFDESRFAVLVCRPVKIENVNLFYLTPVTKSVKTETLLQTASGAGRQAEKKRTGMGGIERKD